MLVRLHPRPPFDSPFRVLEERASYSNIKKCLWCSEIKPIHDFSKNRSQKSGYDAQCKKCHAEYERRRLQSIREGTWKPTRKHRDVLDPIREPTVVEIAWAAGFLEGEGHFRRRVNSGLGAHGSEHASASQVHPEPLYKLQEYFGGTISKINREKWNIKNEIFVWHVSGERARVVMRTIQPFMSPWRQAQIGKALERNG